MQYYSLRVLCDSEQSYNHSNITSCELYLSYNNRPINISPRSFLFKTESDLRMRAITANKLVLTGFERNTDFTFIINSLESSGFSNVSFE